MKPCSFESACLTIAIAVSSFCLPAMGQSKMSRGTVYIPAINREVRYEKDSAAKEFSVDYRDLIDAKIEIVPPLFDYKTCKDWAAEAKMSNRHDPKEYLAFVGSPIHFKLKILDSNPQAINSAFGADWTNVSHINSAHMKIDYVWAGGSDVIQAGPATEYAVEQDIDKSLNLPENHLSVNSTGYAVFSSRYPVFACDVLNGKVSLKLTYTAAQQNAFQTMPNITPSQISTVSQDVSNSAIALASQNPSGAPSEIYAAGLLGYELNKQGIGKGIFANGKFESLYDQIFKLGPSQPQVLSPSQAQDLFSSMIQVSSKLNWFTVTRDLNSVSE